MGDSMFNLSSSKSVLTAAASVSASVILLRSVVDDIVPDAIRTYFSTRLRTLSNRLSSQLTLVIEELDGLTPNHMFAAANTYLGSKITPSARRFKVDKTETDKDLTLSMDKNQDITHHYNGVEFKWLLLCTPRPENYSNSRHSNAISRAENRTFELTFHKKHKDMVLSMYLPHILREAKAIRERRKTVKLHTIDYNGTDYWSAIDLDHPSTFESIAMDHEEKRTLVEDLERFTKRKEYYRRVGRAWKRGYLLYGPPGSGKSSLVAAMANHLSYSIYDMDLKEVQCNSDLRRLLIGTKSRSILVIEDIDCSVKLENRGSEETDSNPGNEKVSLSAVLNFIDGLWSSCGEERIIVFTTNHKERLDPALLRPGRMDVHIEMSYCTFSSFQILAKNYLGVQSHPVFSEVEEVLNKAQATPAQVAGELMKSEDVDVAIGGLVKFLQAKAAYFFSSSSSSKVKVCRPGCALCLLP